jgi:hypothetical protein
VLGRGRLVADTSVDELLARTQASSLEDAYLDLTRRSVEYQGHDQGDRRGSAVDGGVGGPSVEHEGHGRGGRRSAVDSRIGQDTWRNR